MKPTTLATILALVGLALAKAFSPTPFAIFSVQSSTKQRYLTKNKKKAFKPPAHKSKKKIKASDDPNEKETEFNPAERVLEKMEEGLAQDFVKTALKSLKYADAQVNDATNVMNEAAKVVIDYTAKIKEIEDRADFTGNEPQYKIFIDRLNESNDRLKEANDRLKEANDRLKEANDRLKEERELYLKLRANKISTPSQLIVEKKVLRKLTEIRDDFPAPSAFGMLRCWKEVLEKVDDQIDFHRVNIDSVSLPITLMHPVFAEFVQNCQSTKENCAFAHDLRRTVLQDYKSEAEMAEAARNILGEYLGVDILVVRKNRYETDGSYRVKGRLLVNLEVKIQPGAGSDPSIQNLGYFIKQLPNNISCQLPCLLLDISGPLFGIYGVMNTDEYHIICEPLCPILPLQNVDNSLIKPFVSRACAALRIAIKSLEKLSTTGEPTGLSRFPYKTSVHIDGVAVTFRYLKRIMRYVFLVECTGPDGSGYKAIAKFTKTYGREVHKYCAENGFAPKLLAYEKIPADWIFVMMENIEMEPISRMDGITRKEQLDDILQSLRSANLVHGDLRRPNVLWNRDQNRVILIDFDWSGMNGTHRYPSDMNTEIEWPDGASAGEFLWLEHDEFWINQLFD